MATAATVTPSPQARGLFNTMAIYAEPYEEDEAILHVDLAGTLRLACHRIRQGHEGSSEAEMDELQQQRWIEPAPDGGWLLT